MLSNNQPPVSLLTHGGQEVFEPQLADRRGLVSGKAEPATSVDRARDVARRLIETYEVEPLEPAVNAEISEILQRHETT